MGSLAPGRPACQLQRIRMQTAERAALVESHAWIVAQFVARYQTRGNAADLAEAGLLGLCEAARRYKPAKRVQFATYAWTWVKGAVLEELRTSHVVPVSKRAALGKTLEPVRLPRFEIVAPTENRSQNANGGGNNGTYRRLVAQGLTVEPECEEVADLARRRRIARARVARLPTPDHRRVAFRALQGRSVEQIAEALEMPTGRVQYLLSEAQFHLSNEAA